MKRIKHNIKYSSSRALFFLIGQYNHISTLFSNQDIFSLSPLVVDQVSPAYVKTGRRKLKYRHYFNRLESSFDLNNFPKT